MTRSPRELAQQKIQQRKQQEKLFSDLLTVVDALDRASDHWQKAYNNVNPDIQPDAEPSELEHGQIGQVDRESNVESDAEPITEANETEKPLNPESSAISDPAVDAGASHDESSAYNTRSPVAEMNQWKTLSWLRKWRIWWKERAEATPDAALSPFASFQKPQRPFLPSHPPKTLSQETCPPLSLSDHHEQGQIDAKLEQSSEADSRAELREMIASALDGTQLIHTSMLEILDKHHVTPILAQHQRFDPESMKALGQEPDSSVPPNTVVQEIVRGYRWKDRVLREAQVIVSVAPLPSTSPEEGTSETTEGREN